MILINQKSLEEYKIIYQHCWWCTPLNHDGRKWWTLNRPRQCVADHSPTCESHPSPRSAESQFARHQTGAASPRPGLGFAQPLLGWFLSLVVLGSVSRLLNSKAWGWWNETIQTRFHLQKMVPGNASSYIIFMSGFLLSSQPKKMTSSD